MTLILVDLDEFEAMVETLDILSDDDTMAAIRDGEAGLYDEAHWAPTNALGY